MTDRDHIRTAAALLRRWCSLPRMTADDESEIIDLIRRAIAPAQARALAQGIIAAADKAEAGAMSAYNLDADIFMRVRRAAGAEEFRYDLTGVHVEPAPGGGALMVATDGRVMLVARDPHGFAPAPAIVRLTMPESSPPDPSCCDDGFCAIMADSYVGVRMTFDLPDKGPAIAAMMRGAHPYKHAIVERVKGEFPDWRKAWSAGVHQITPRRGHQAFGINPELLARITAGDRIVLRPLHGGPAQQVIFDGIGEIAGVIMPCDLTQTEGSAELADSLTAAEGKQ